MLVSLCLPVKVATPWNNQASDVAMIMIKYLNYVNLCEAVILFPEPLSVIYLSKTFVE